MARKNHIKALISQKSLNERKVKFLYTREDWSGNYDNNGNTAWCIYQITGTYPSESDFNYCKASLSRSSGKGGWYISIAGNDDFGYTCNKLTCADACDLWEKLPEPMTKKWCEDHGFERW